MVRRIYKMKQFNFLTRFTLLLVTGLALQAVAESSVDLVFLKELMRIPSVSADVAAVNRAADFTQRYAESKGLFCQIETNAAGRCMVWVANTAGKTPDVLLSAHLDVVPAQSPDLFVPKESNGRIHGRGASDCKEHVALSLHLMARLAGRVSIGAIFGTDEEIGGSTTAEMVKRGYGARKLVIVLDSEQFAITTRQKGLARYVIEASAPPTHAGMAKGAPPNAARDLIRRFEEAAALIPDHEDGSWRDVMMLERVSGTRTRAEIEISVRCARPGGFPAIEKLLREKFGRDLRCLRKGEAVMLDETQPYLVEFRNRMRRAWPDRKIDFFHLNSSTDARHLQVLNLPLLILGVDARGAHTATEHVVVSSLDEYANLISACLVDWSAQGWHIRTSTPVALPIPADAPAASEPCYGVCAHVVRGDFADSHRIFDRMRLAGIDAVRCDIAWRRCQKEPGGKFDFSLYDSLFAGAKAVGVDVLPVILYPPDWARPVHRHLPELTAYVEALMEHLRGQIRAIEAWNEPNLPQFWGMRRTPRTIWPRFPPCTRR